MHFLIRKLFNDTQIIDTFSFKRRTHLWHHVFYISISFVFNFFFRRCDLLTKNANVDEKKEKVKEIEKVTTEVKTEITIKMKRLLNSRRRDVCILINIALFIYLNKRSIYHYNKCVKLFMRYLKSVKILVIALQSSFALFQN